MLQENTIGNGNGSYQVGNVMVQRAPERPASMGSLVIISVNLRALSKGRKLKTDLIEVDSDKDMIHVSKDIFDCDEYTAIRQLDGQIRRYVKSRCVNFFRNGFNLIKAKLADEVNAQLKEYAAARELLFDALKNKYLDIIAAAKVRLRSNFNEKDYPPASALAGYFTMTWNFVEFSTPTGLSPEMRAQETAKLKANFSNAFAKSTEALTAGMSDTIRFLVEKLSAKKDGTRASLTEKGSEGMLAKVREFFASVEALNIAEDADLTRLTEQAEAILNGVEPEGLRNSTVIADRVLEGFQTLKSNLDALIVEKGREISFDVEE